MLKIKKSSDRGFNQMDWLKSFHSFSFASYYDPTNMNFSHLRVINEDWIAPRTGFGFHPHKDMEIVTFMLEGAIEHKDNLGNVGQLKQGKVQLMRAGTGIVHSEMNNFDSQAHLLQIWITPEQKNLKPGWWEKEFDTTSDLEIIASPVNPGFKLQVNSDEYDSESGLKMAQQGYIVKVSGQHEFDFDDNEVYLHALGNTVIDADKNYHIDNGDALYGKISGKMKIDTGSHAILLFVFK